MSFVRINKTHLSFSSSFRRCPSQQMGWRRGWGFGRGLRRVADWFRSMMFYSWRFHFYVLVTPWVSILGRASWLWSHWCVAGTSGVCGSRSMRICFEWRSQWLDPGYELDDAVFVCLFVFPLKNRPCLYISSTIIHFWKGKHFEGKADVRECTEFHVLIPPIRAGLTAQPIKITIGTFVFLLLLFPLPSFLFPKT